MLVRELSNAQSQASVPLKFVITSYSIHYTKLYEKVAISILKFDLLLHEKPRSLPNWCEEINYQIKDESYNFIVKNNSAYELLPEYQDCELKQLYKLVV